MSWVAVIVFVKTRLMCFSFTHTWLDKDVTCNIVWGRVKMTFDPILIDTEKSKMSEYKFNQSVGRLQNAGERASAVVRASYGCCVCYRDSLLLVVFYTEVDF